MWRTLSQRSVLKEEEVLQKTHPAHFRVFTSRKGVLQDVTTKEPAMPLGIIYKKGFVTYQWRIHDERGVHNTLLSEINEYALTAPHGRMIFWDALLFKEGLYGVAVTLTAPSETTAVPDEFTDEATYGGAIRDSEARVFVTFKRFVAITATTTATDDETVTPPPKEGEEEEEAETEESTETPTAPSEQESSPLPVRTLASVSVVMRTSFA
jgi:hypothetical protein